MGSGVLIYFFFFYFVYLIFFFPQLYLIFLFLSIFICPSQVQISSSVCLTSYYILLHCFPYMLAFLSLFLSFLSIVLWFSFFSLSLFFFLSTSKSDPEASIANIRHFSQSDPKWQTIDCRQQKMFLSFVKDIIDVFW